MATRATRASRMPRHHSRRHRHDHFHGQEITGHFLNAPTSAKCRMMAVRDHKAIRYSMNFLLYEVPS